MAGKGIGRLYLDISPEQSWGASLYFFLFQMVNFGGMRRALCDPVDEGGNTMPKPRDEQWDIRRKGRAWRKEAMRRWEWRLDDNVSAKNR